MFTRLLYQLVVTRRIFIFGTKKIFAWHISGFQIDAIQFTLYDSILMFYLFVDVVQQSTKLLLILLVFTRFQLE